MFANRPNSRRNSLHLTIGLLATLLPSCLAAVSVNGVSYSNVIYVDCESGNNTQDCGSVQTPCRTLVQAVSILQNDTLISIPSSTVCALNETVTISGYVNVGIAGNTNLTINCSRGQNLISGSLFLTAIRNLQLANLTFSHCSGLFNSTSRSLTSPTATDQFHVAVYVINVTNLMVHSTNFYSSPGVGLAVYDTDGNVSVVQCAFIDNRIPQNKQNTYPGGGGMLLHYSYCTPGIISCDPSTNTHNSHSNILIDGCHFSGNEASNVNTFKSIKRQQGNDTVTLGSGGGLGITFAGNSTANTMTLQNLVFCNNSGVLGGAANVLFLDNADSNTFIVTGTFMENNTASLDGGAMLIGMEFYDYAPCVSNNSVHIISTYFLSNTAKWAGGVTFYSSRTREGSNCRNTLVFQDCTWESNHAEIAAAVDIVLNAFSNLQTGYLPVPVFEECSFMNNALLSSTSEVLTGILNVQSFEVQFKSYVIFESNLGTPVYSSDSVVAVGIDTQVNFTNNTAITGGGIALIGSSVLQINPGSHLYFTNNTALELGGAIYYYGTSPSLFLYSFTCFIQYANSRVKPENWTNVTFFFENNVAAVYGHAIYATTLLPCARAYGNDSNSLSDNLHQLFIEPPFHYYNYYKHYLIATAPDWLSYRDGQYFSLSVAPGQTFETGVVAFDELNQTVQTTFHAVITNGSNATISSIYSYTTDGTLQLYGMPRQAVQLSLETTGSMKIEKTIDIYLTTCPPGYYLHPNGSHSQCLCSADSTGHTVGGIFHCNAAKFKGILHVGYWGGCLPGHDNQFVTGQCPLGFCNQSSQGLELPHTCDEVDQLLCGPRHRTGTLCGECAPHHTVHYHSKRYACGKCHYPNLGLLFYALSELLPLTLLFVVIVTFGISFTSGPANSFILFAQVLNFFDVTSLDTLQVPGAVTYLTDIYQFIFGAFNFDFFKLDIFSFCLWKNAKILDIFVFKYVTTAYALALLFIFVLAVKLIPRCYFCLQRFVFRNTVTSSLIQAMSALLIISYSQCAKVSFQILTPHTLTGENLEPKKRVVFLSGKTDYFSPDHLPYAIPAVFVLFLTTIPPGLLIFYPTLAKVITWCATCREDDEEHDKVRCVSWWNARLMPFLDSFQGCFKHNCRYFAGLYFIYRLAISMAFALSDNGMLFYFSLEVIVIVMLAFHAVMQPYQNRFYNIVDTAIFADLAIINGLSIYDFYWSQFSNASDGTIAVASSIQVVLIYLPILYMSVMVILKIGVRFRRVHRLQCIKKLNCYIPLISEHLQDGYQRMDLDEDSLPPRLYEENTRNRRNVQARYGAAARVTM